MGQGLHRVDQHGQGLAAFSRSLPAPRAGGLGLLRSAPARGARQAQDDLAREHGIEAFCYDHYWFGGRRILDASGRRDPEVRQAGLSVLLVLGQPQLD